MKLDFSKLNGLVPAVIQDSATKNVLMVGFMNEEALEKTTREKKITFFSRSKNRLWTKGETSNNFLTVNKIIADCDNDTLLILAQPNGPTCHTGQTTCFGEENEVNFLYKLINIIHQRKMAPNPTSYTSSLFKKGIKKVAQKVGEEAGELLLEAENGNSNDFINEASDLLFHYLVLLEAKEITFSSIIKNLEERNR